MTTNIDKFECLKQIGISKISEIEEKLRFTGKIDSTKNETWTVQGMTYNPYAILTLRMRISNGSKVVKIIYQEKIDGHQGPKIPVIEIIDRHLYTCCSLNMLDQNGQIFGQNKTLENSDKKVVQLKAAS